MFVVCIVAAFMLFIYKVIMKKHVNLDGQHVMVTGGSSGIGKCVAEEALKRGASVSLLARNSEKLDATKNEIEKFMTDRTKQQVCCYSVDISSNFNDVAVVVNQAEQDLGKVNILVNCAGTSISGRFEDQQLSEFKRLMDINYFGTVNVTRAVLPSMKQRQNGHVVFTSSLCGLTGLYGYTSYAASKFALRGLAESLQMEVKPYNISITMNFPPDTNTPGFEEEQKSKPLETRLLSETSGIVSPEAVAKKLLEDTLDRKFFSVLGIDGYVVATVGAGMAPISSVFNLFMEIALMGIFRMIAAFQLFRFDQIIKRCMKEKDQNKKQS